MDKIAHSFPNHSLLPPFYSLFFMVLATTLSFTKTADEVFMSQQAVSRAIARLEKETKLQLFTRSTRMVKLTDEGKRLYEFFAEYEETYKSLITTLQREQNPNTLHIGYQNFISYYENLRKAMNGVKDAYPASKMEAGRYPPPVLVKKLVSGELDLAILYRRFFKSENFNTLPLHEVHQMFMCSEELDVPADDPLTFLRAQPFVIDCVDGESPREQQDRIHREYERWGFTGQIIVTPDRDSAYTYAEMGYGVVVGTHISIMSYGRALQTFSCGTQPEQLVVAWRKDEINPVISAYIKHLQHVFETNTD